MPGYVSGLDEEGNEVIEFDFPTQREINEQDTPFLRACLQLNRRMEIMGLPHGKGWLEERSTVVQIREICEAQKNGYEHWRHTKGKDLEDRD